MRAYARYNDRLQRANNNKNTANNETKYDLHEFWNERN